LASVQEPRRSLTTDPFGVTRIVAPNMPGVRMIASKRVQHFGKGAAATEAMRLASITGMPHHIVEQITSRRQAIEGYARAMALQRV